MRIITRYVLREYLIPLGYCLCGFVSIYVLFELFGSFSRLADAKLPAKTVVEYFCAYLAPYFEWLAPAALMLTHFSTSLETPEDYLDGVRTIFEKTWTAKDGETITLRYPAEEEKAWISLC